MFAAHGKGNNVVDGRSHPSITAKEAVNQLIADAALPLVTTKDIKMTNIVTLFHDSPTLARVEATPHISTLSPANVAIRVLQTCLLRVPHAL